MVGGPDQRHTSGRRVVRPARASLRRADWRFLLPAPPGGIFQHLVLLGGPADLGSRLVEVGTAVRVSTNVPLEPSADALVILADAGVLPRDVRRCLAPGAVMYWEIDRRGLQRLAKRPAWITMQLRGCGLERCGTYWVIPDFLDARRYLPLDAAAAVEWFFETRFVASTPARRSLDLLVRTIRGWSERSLEALVPCCGVTAAAASRPFTPPSILADPSLPESLRVSGVRPVMFTSGQDDGSRLVLLPFPQGARAPALVLKRARLPEFAGHTEREQATLTQLRAQLDPELRRTLPEPLGDMGNSAGRAFAETSVPGQMLAASIGRWPAAPNRQVEDLRLAADWLGRFHLATMVRRVRWSAAEIERWIEPALSGFERSLGTRPEERRLFEAIRERAAMLLGEALPIVWVHNDFGPWHIYRLGSEVSVIDWEFGGESLTQRQGLPLCDLAYFAVHWIHLATGLKGDAAELRGFHRLIFGTPGQERRTDAARAALAEYMGRLEIPPGFLPMLIAQTWIDRAREKDERQETLGIPRADRRRDNRFAQYVEILARGTDNLFGPAHPPR
jgi:hypothetical protein